MHDVVSLHVVVPCVVACIFSRLVPLCVLHFASLAASGARGAASRMTGKYMLQKPLKSAEIRTRGAKIGSSWLNAPAATVEERDTEQYGHKPVFKSTEVADTIKAEMRKTLIERPENVFAPSRSRRKPRHVTLQIPEHATGEVSSASAAEHSAVQGAGNHCEDVSSETRLSMLSRCMTMTLQNAEGSVEPGTKLVYLSELHGLFHRIPVCFPSAIQDDVR
jgi:hypothetical protein